MIGLRGVEVSLLLPSGHLDRFGERNCDGSRFSSLEGSESMCCALRLMGEASVVIATRWCKSLDRTIDRWRD